MSTCCQLVGSCLSLTRRIVCRTQTGFVSGRSTSLEIVLYLWLPCHVVRAGSPSVPAKARSPLATVCASRYLVTAFLAAKFTCKGGTGSLFRPSCTWPVGFPAVALLFDCLFLTHHPQTLVQGLVRCGTLGREVEARTCGVTKLSQHRALVLTAQGPLGLSKPHCCVSVISIFTPLDELGCASVPGPLGTDVLRVSPILSRFRIFLADALQRTVPWHTNIPWNGMFREH